MRNIIYKTADREVVIDMDLERVITIGGVRIRTEPNNRCAAFCIDSGDRVDIDSEWKCIKDCQLKEVA